MPDDSDIGGLSVRIFWKFLNIPRLEVAWDSRLKEYENSGQNVGPNILVENRGFPCRKGPRKSTIGVRDFKIFSEDGGRGQIGTDRRKSMIGIGKGRVVL